MLLTAIYFISAGDDTEISITGKLIDKVGSKTAFAASLNQILQWLQTALHEREVRDLIAHNWGPTFYPWAIFCIQRGLPRSADPTQHVHPPKRSIKGLQMYSP